VTPNGLRISHVATVNREGNVADTDAKIGRSCGREAASGYMCVLGGETNGFVFGSRIRLLD
jgi:hypothetical protein